jgi:threonine/homoserine/homoserine lactone efflux protein
MQEAILQVLIFGVATTLSPIPIIAVIPLLTAGPGVTRGWAFLGGWMTGLLAAGGVALVAFGGAASYDDQGASGAWMSIIRLVLGLGAIALAVKSWTKRPAPESTPDAPQWVQKLSDLSIPKTAGVGVLLAAANPKILVFVLGATSAIASAEADVSGRILALVIFSTVGSIGTLLPVGIATFGGPSGSSIVDQLGVWVSRNNAVIGAVIFLLLGFKLITDGISGLS